MEMKTEITSPKKETANKPFGISKTLVDHDRRDLASCFIFYNF
jgi:hypothetical protein